MCTDFDMIFQLKLYEVKFGYNKQDLDRWNHYNQSSLQPGWFVYSK